MIKQLKALRSFVAFMMILVLSACSQSPVRNPFEGRSEPKLGSLAPLADDNPIKIAKVSWSKKALAKQERFSKLTPHVDGPIIYAADHTGKVIALYSNNGKKHWSTNTHLKFTAGPSLMGNLLLLATSDAKVVALDKTNGQLVWEAKVPSEVLSSPTGQQGVVLVYAMDGSISALDGRTGSKLWMANESTPSLTLHFCSAPVIVNDKVLVGLSTGKLVALNLKSGLIEWERTIAVGHGRSELQRMVDISADPLVQDSIVYVITYQGKLAALNVSSGNLLWERELSSYHNMALKGDSLFVTDNEHHLWAIDRHTGSTQWKQSQLANRYITGPAEVSGLIAVADRGGYIHFLSPKQGHIVNRFHLSGKLYQDPQSSGNKLIVHAHNGKIAAISVSPQRNA